MNIPSKFNKLHTFYRHARYAFLAVFAITVLFSSSISHRVYGESVVGTVITKIVLEIDGKTSDITTTQNTIEGALKQNNIILAKNDITEPSMDTYLTGRRLDVSVVRAVPVLISDNGQSWPATSAYNQPYDILKQLNVEIFPEDRVSAELIMDPAAEGAIGQKVLIERAPIYTIHVDDMTKVVRSWATNISDLLVEEDISLGVNDIVEPAKGALLTGVSEITVTRINYADIEETISIPFETIYKIDPALGLNGKRVENEGVTGSKTNTYHIVYRNGVETSKVMTSSVVSTPSQNRVIYRGAQVGRANWGFYSGMTTAFKGTRGQNLIVTNLSNGKSITVKVVDYGPVNALLDLGKEAFIALGGDPGDGYMTNIAVQLAD